MCRTMALCPLVLLLLFTTAPGRVSASRSLNTQIGSRSTQPQDVSLTVNVPASGAANLWLHTTEQLSPAAAVKATPLANQLPGAAPKAQLLGSAQTTALPTAQDYLPGYEPQNLPPWVYARTGNSYQNSYEQYNGQEPYGGKQHPYYQQHDRYDSKEEARVLSFVAKDGTSVLRAGFTTDSSGAGPAGSPVLIQYRADLTCGASTNVAVGRCYVTGSAEDYTATKAHVYATCTLKDDFASVCGVKSFPGIIIAAQGEANVAFDSAAPYDIQSLSGAALVITGTYVPSRRNTQATYKQLPDVKGGTMTFDATATDGHFSFFLELQ